MVSKYQNQELLNFQEQMYFSTATVSNAILMRANVFALLGERHLSMQGEVVAEAEVGAAEDVVLVVDEVEVSVVEVPREVVEEEAHAAVVDLGAVVEHRLANSCYNLCSCLFVNRDACWFSYVELDCDFNFNIRFVRHIY